MLSTTAMAASRGGDALASEVARPRHGASFSQRAATSTALGSSRSRARRAVSVEAQASWGGAGR